jgi:hypothetical protein
VTPKTPLEWGISEHPSSVWNIHQESRKCWSIMRQEMFTTSSWDHLQSFRETINCQWNMHFTPLACTSTHFVHDLAGQACHDFHGSNMFHNFSRYFSKEWLKYISRESMFGSNPFPDTVSVLSISQNLFATN